MSSQARREPDSPLGQEAPSPPPKSQEAVATAVAKLHQRQEQQDRQEQQQQQQQQREAVCQERAPGRCVGCGRLAGGVADSAGSLESAPIGETSCDAHNDAAAAHEQSSISNKQPVGATKETETQTRANHATLESLEDAERSSHSNNQVPKRAGSNTRLASGRAPSVSPAPGQVPLERSMKCATQFKRHLANMDTMHVVVCNEACDLDSAVSCLLIFHIISKMSDEINGKDKTRTLYLPLINTTRDMLDSKTEVLWFLQKTLNIDKSFLTCKDDVDWAEVKRNGIEVLLTLVDHNYNDEFKDIGRVVEIVDHHQVQNPQWLMDLQATGGLRLTLDTAVGSCTTLVAERLFYIYAEHHVSDEILLLIYGTVLLDTICLSEKAKRFTRRDVYLLKKLDSLLGSKRPVREELYKQLVEVKNATSQELNFEKLMKRDLKVYKDKHGKRVGIASLFGMAAKEALGLAASIDLDQFFRQNQYEAFIIMGLIADLEQSDGISRDLVLISANEHLFAELHEAFERDTSKLDLIAIGADSSPDLEDAANIGALSGSSSGSGGQRRLITSGSIDAAENTYQTKIWVQRNVSASRKVIAPLVLKDILEASAMDKALRVFGRVVPFVNGLTYVTIMVTSAYQIYKCYQEYKNFKERSQRDRLDPHDYEELVVRPRKRTRFGPSPTKQQEEPQQSTSSEANATAPQEPIIEIVSPQRSTVSNVSLIDPEDVSDVANSSDLVSIDSDDAASISCESSDEVIDFFSRCAICSRSLTDPEKEVSRLPMCMHPFHKQCLDGVLKFHKKCPVCDVHIFTPY